MRYDLVLLHPPSYYDFRKANQFRGPVSDVIPSSSVFDMYAIGLTSIAGYLERFGYRVKIVNLAARMLRDANFDVEKKIRGLNAAAFGVSLHWLPHAQGSIEIARLVKRYHPGTPVIFGGLSASYFHRELLGYGCVDFVVRGDSTESAVRQLLDAITAGAVDYSGVPNLSWKRDTGAVINPTAPPPLRLDDIDVPNYRYAVRAVLHYRNLLDMLPYQGWLQYPLSALLTVRGCTQDCSLCGGSRSAYQLNCGRARPSLRSPAKLVEDIAFIQRFSRAPIFVIGDIRQGGSAYVDELLAAVARLRPKNELVFELFWPADQEFFARLQQNVPHYSLEITLESGDEELRRVNGKFNCSNQAVLDTLQAALAHACRKIDVFFMVGLPHQSHASALGNVDFCESMHVACGLDPRLHYFIAPLAPFLDPASRAFEAPEQFGYRRLATTLAEHIELFTAPSWEFFLNYETDELDREHLVKATYASLEKLNDFKLRYGLIAADAHRAIAGELAAARLHLDRVRAAVRSGAPPETWPRWTEPASGTSSSKAELRWKVQHRYASWPTLLAMGCQFLAEELRGRIIDRATVGRLQERKSLP